MLSDNEFLTERDKAVFAAGGFGGAQAGFGKYRLEWQSLGSLQRRLRNCLVGMRAET